MHVEIETPDIGMCTQHANVLGTAVSLRYVHGHLDTPPKLISLPKLSVATCIATVRSLCLLCAALHPVKIEAIVCSTV